MWCLWSWDSRKWLSSQSCWKNPCGRMGGRQLKRETPIPATRGGGHSSCEQMIFLLGDVETAALCIVPDLPLYCWWNFSFSIAAAYIGKLLVIQHTHSWAYFSDIAWLFQNMDACGRWRAWVYTDLPVFWNAYMLLFVWLIDLGPWKKIILTSSRVGGSCSFRQMLPNILGRGEQQMLCVAFYDIRRDSTPSQYNHQCFDKGGFPGS